MTVSVNVQMHPRGTYHFAETIYLQQPNLPVDHEDEAVILPQNTATNFVIASEPQELFY